MQFSWSVDALHVQSTYKDHFRIVCQILSDFYSIQHFYWMKNRRLKAKITFVRKCNLLATLHRKGYVSRKQSVVKNKAFIFLLFVQAIWHPHVFFPATSYRNSLHLIICSIQYLICHILSIVFSLTFLLPFYFFNPFIKTCLCQILKT
jgi:hypothetical protein